MKKTFALLFTAFILFSACKKSSDSSSTSTSTDYYYEATIDGVVYKETIPKNTTDVKLLAGSGTHTLGDDAWFGSSIENSHTGGTLMSMSKGVLHSFSTITENRFKAFFPNASFGFAPEGSSLGVDGFEIGWTDKNGKTWTTQLGTHNQSGSTIAIISTQEERDDLGNLFIKATIKFNCKFYDGVGNVKAANGTFVGIFSY
jgi:hypothetical protein